MSPNVSPKAAVQIQKEMRDQIVLSPLADSLGRPIRYIGGCDVSLNRFSPEIFAGIIVLSYPDLVPVGHAVFKSRTDFPYIPGLLSFREIPALMECWNILKKKVSSVPLPDVILVDGQGIAHPRRLGIATHFGILADIPTIGCAKSLLYGHFTEPALEAGSVSPIFEGYKTQKKITEEIIEEIIGMAVRSKKNVKPLIISPGYKTTVEDAVDITLACIRKYRLPETTRLAHELVNSFRREEIVN